MQHHPGSWYLPWGVGMPLQKMLALPYQHAAAAGNAGAYATGPGTSPNGGTTQLSCAVLPAQPNQQHSPNSMNGMPAASPQSYQHAAAAAAALHATQIPIGSYNCPNTGVTLSHAPHAGSLLGNNPAAAHAAHMQNTQALHQAAAAMFTPMSLRSFLATAAANHQLAALTPHQTQMQTPCGNMHAHAQTTGVVAAAQVAAAAAAAAAAQQITCVPNSMSPQQQQHQHLQQQQQQQQQQHQQQQQQLQQQQQQQQFNAAMNLNVGVVAMRHQASVTNGYNSNSNMLPLTIKKVSWLGKTQITTFAVEFIYRS